MRIFCATLLTPAQTDQYRRGEPVNPLPAPGVENILSCRFRTSHHVSRASQPTVGKLSRECALRLIFSRLRLVFFAPGRSEWFFIRKCNVTFDEDCARVRFVCVTLGKR